jgi:hypothetical protein
VKPIKKYHYLLTAKSWMQDAADGGYWYDA